MGKNETNVRGVLDETKKKRCCGQSAYVGYVGYVGYVEMVARLPKTNKKWKYFVNQTKDRMASTNT